VLWGDPGRKDLTGEYFTQKTAELTTIFEAMGRLPLLYHHGADGKLATQIVGPVDVMRMDEAGLWYEAQLTMAGQYREAIDGLIGQGLLGTSSGTLPAARRVDVRSGRITRWPIAELSLTPTPAEPRMMERPVAEVKAAYQALGLDAEWIGAEDAVGQSAGADCNDNRDYASETAKANEPEDGQPDDGEMTQIKDTMVELERLALLKLRRTTQ
jgi:hypothetical protein